MSSLITELPPEINMEILYKLDPFQVQDACKTNKYFYKKVCTPLFKNLYQIKNAKEFYLYQIGTKKFIRLGLFYALIGYYSDYLVLADLKGNIIIYNININKFELFPEKGIYRYLTNVSNDITYGIDYNGNLVVLTPEDYQIIATKLYGFKIKNAILVDYKAVILYNNGELYYLENYIKSKPVLLANNIEQIAHGSYDLDIILLNRNGGVSRYDLEDKINQKMGFSPKFEYIHPNRYASRLFLQDDQQQGWLWNLSTNKLELLGSNLKEGLYYKKYNLIVALTLDGVVIYKRIDEKDFKLFESPVEKRVEHIYMVVTDLILEYAIKN